MPILNKAWFCTGFNLASLNPNKPGQLVKVQQCDWCGQLETAETEKLKMV